ncbi:MAG: FAD-binding protein [Deltaproteobacteria bacterium]|nr:FAD-binding protein [Deltaproteobacteria bacterium]
MGCHEQVAAHPLHAGHARAVAGAGAGAVGCAGCHVEHPRGAAPARLVDVGRCASCHPAAGPEARHAALRAAPRLPPGVGAPWVAGPVGLRPSRDALALHQAHDHLPGACVGCHADDERAGPSADPGGECLRCHGPRGEGGAAAAAGSAGAAARAALTAEAAAALAGPGCLSCHAAPGSRAAPLAPPPAASGGGPTPPAAGPLAALALLGLVGVASGRWAPRPRRSRPEEAGGAAGAGEAAGGGARQKKLIHIFEDSCVGCGECVTACPFEVLALTQNPARKLVARVVNFDSCNECNDCVVVCKPQALTRLRAGEPLPMVRAPELDAHYMTNLHGLYVIGEAAGASLVRHANNLGARAALHLEHRGEAGRALDGELDVLIVGAGPAGLSAAITAHRRGLRYALLEQGGAPLSTLAEHYPKGKDIQNQPLSVENIGPLPMDGWDVMKKERFLSLCAPVLAESGVAVTLNAKVTEVRALAAVEDGDPSRAARFAVVASGVERRARNVILALGTRGQPRPLPCPGADSALVRYHLVDPQAHAAERAVVVGGGNSALEAAIALAEARGAAGAPVRLVHRGPSFSKASDRNVRRVEELAARGAVQLHLNATPREVLPGALGLKGEGEPVDLACDVIFCMLGAEAPTDWLKAIGVQFVERPQGWVPAQSDDLTFLELPPV